MNNGWINIPQFYSDECFVVGKESFSDLEIRPAKEGGDFYYFFNVKMNHLVKQFILDDKPKVSYICQVVLIKKSDKFTPRLSFSIRDKYGKITDDLQQTKQIKANINLNDCHENFWKLISFMQSLTKIEIPQGDFSLITQEDEEIVKALRGRNIESIKKIIKQLSATKGVFLSEDDVSQLLNHKEKTQEFESGMASHASDEDWWQNYFEINKWIFGYGLNYQILRQEQGQAHYGGSRIDGKGDHRGDYLTSTMGEINFTVLVEIKTPNTTLLQGSKEIRSGAWSISKDFTDAISQIQSNIQTWDQEGSKQQDNRTKFEDNSIFTVQPKGIIIIGSLGEFGEERSKRETFQRFRKSIHGIDIITYDELLYRAKYISGLSQ
jgi:hypothetical protein